MARQKLGLKTKNKRILIIEDDAICASVIKTSLESMGFTKIVIAPTGKEALKLLSSRRFDLIFLDFHLSDTNGIELCDYYFKNNAFRRHPPIICCSAVSDFSSNTLLAKECLEAGMSDFLHKPVSAEKLKKIIERWLEK